MKKDNLLIVAPYLNQTGSSSVLIDVIKEYSKSYNVYLYLYEKSYSFKKDKFFKSIIFSPVSYNIYFFYFIKLFRKITRVDIDWVFIFLIIKFNKIKYVHLNTLNVINHCPKIRKLGIMVHVHVHEHIDRYFNYYKGIIRQLQEANLIIVPSTLVKNQLSAIINSNILVYYHLPNIKHSQRKNDVRSFWNDHKLHDFEFIWVTAGSFIQSKGVKYLLELLPFLKKHKAAIIWMGYCYGDGFTEYLDFWMDQNKIKNLILPGNIDKSIYYSIISSCDGYISLSEYESYGLSILESYLLGLPIVAFDNIGVKEIAVEISLIKYFNTEKMKTEMLKIMRNKPAKNERVLNLQTNSDLNIFSF